MQPSPSCSITIVGARSGAGRRAPRASANTVDAVSTVARCRRRRGGRWYGRGDGRGGVVFGEGSKKDIIKVQPTFACSDGRGGRGRRLGRGEAKGIVKGIVTVLVVVAHEDAELFFHVVEGRDLLVLGSRRFSGASEAVVLRMGHEYIRVAPERVLHRIGWRLELYRSLGRLTKRLCGLED